MVAVIGGDKKGARRNSITGKENVSSRTGNWMSLGLPLSGTRDVEIGGDRKRQ